MNNFIKEFTPLEKKHSVKKNFLTGFKKRIYKKEIKIGVVGLGYVGLPLAIEFAKKGFNVLGIEIDKGRIEHIRRQESYITDVTTQDLRKVLKSNKFSVISDFTALKQVQVVIICVPTPLKRKYQPDISYIVQAAHAISKNVQKGSLIILESTTYPGTTEEVILPLLESKGLKCGSDFYLAFSPERIDPGNMQHPLNKIPKVIGGITKEATELTGALYKNIIDRVVPVSSARAAEIVKLIENTFRIVNIALIDEMAMMAHKMNIDIWEVINAAKTKPFGFMPFYPGPGVGGHCLDKNEILYVKDRGFLKIMRMPDFIKHIQNNKDKDVEVLSFDPVKKRSVFKKVIAASARLYSGQMYDVLTEDGRHIKVTDLHPMFIYEGVSWRLKYAKDLQKGNYLPVCLELPRFEQHILSSAIDLIDEIAQRGQCMVNKIRVKPMGFLWRDYSKTIKYILRQEFNVKLPDKCWDYLSDNILPLKYFYILEKLVNIDHRKIKLVTGRGSSYSETPAIIELNEDFCRLIGYYLSEGCYTKDESIRVRFSFNRSEKEYVQDAVDILHRLGIRTSIYESKTWNTSCIKVSSNIFGFLIHKVLGCGKNCYDMNIPERFFSLDRKKKKAVISGIFRGDACVEHFFGKWRYRKNEKEYFHKVNTANISFFTSSEKLFQQLIVLLQDLNIVPTFRKRKYSISIFGYKQLSFLKDLFAGKKKEIIERYLKLNIKRSSNKTFKKVDKFAVVKVKSVLPVKGDWVYSVETAKPHAFVSSYGITVHNCIPKDPLYLYWKAKHYGFHSRFIKLASKIVSYMPEYIVQRLEQILKEKSINLLHAKILIIGVTYKKDIKDLRKSPALDIIEILQRHKAHVSYYDPLIPYLKFNHFNLKSISPDSRTINKFHCVVIATDHSMIDYKFVLKNSEIIFDTRNVYKNINNKKIYKL